MSLASDYVEPGPRLLCLDALVPRADCDASVAPDTAWSANTRRLLGHARAQGWMVAHVIGERLKPGQASWQALAGLGPEPREPVFHRDSPSAFSSAALCESLGDRPVAEIVLCGVSQRGSCLATALDAARLGLRLILASDALWVGEREREGLNGLLSLQHGALAFPSRLRTSDVAGLLRPRYQLRLLPGGRH